MLFITNRTPKKERSKKDTKSSTFGQSYEFDLDINSPSNSIYCCERISENKYIELGSQSLLSKLKNSKAEQVLLFIHGFSNLPEPDIFPPCPQNAGVF